MTTSARTCPALLLAAPASGQGKTTVTAALARLHTRAGRKVRVFKCGPDFLDPFWLKLASGAPVHQIDLWMCGEADVRERLWLAAEEADLILVEGVMGLFDGQPSAADLAARFNLPLAAIIDASAMAGTFGALAHGLMTYRDGLRWAGVLANRVGSAGHGEMLRAGLRDTRNWLGALAREDAIRMPERHLGLTVATEIEAPLALLDRAADALAQTGLGQWTADWHQTLATRFPAPEIPSATPPLLAGKRIAIARDAAFCFIYEANVDVLARLGAEITFFAPLKGDALPDCDAIWLPGGYPELHAPALAARSDLRRAIADHLASGRAIWAECGGMMVLFETLRTLDGTQHAMWGLLPGTVAMQPRLAALGMQELKLAKGALRGHAFHFSKVEQADAAIVARAQKHSSIGHSGPGEAVYGQGPLRGTYFHAWFPSSPDAAASLFQPEALS